MTDAIAYIDLWQLIKSFAKAIQKHISYSKGLYFTDDLKRLNDLMEAEGFKTSGNLDFSYALDQQLKIKFDDMKKATVEEKKKAEEEGKTKNEDAF